MRTLARVALAVLGVVLLLSGAIVVGATVWAHDRLTATSGDWILRSDSQVIDAAECSSVLIEVSDIRVDGNDLTSIEPFEQRGVALFTVTPIGADGSSWLVGTAQASEIEKHLLGSRYCVASTSNGTWTVNLVAIDADAPDLRIDGVSGMWADVASGENVVFSSPVTNSTVVITGDGDNQLEGIELAGEYRFLGVSDLAWIGLTGGLLTVILGVALIIVSVKAMRSRGRHE